MVFEVVSRPEHLREWWPDEADLEPVPGRYGGDRRSATDGERTRSRVDGGRRRAAAAVLVPLGVRRRASRPRPENSLLVTFDLVPSGAGTLLRFTETGFREKGWEAAVLEEQYRDHVAGWDHFLPRLVAYAAPAGGRA